MAGRKPHSLKNSFKRLVLIEAMLYLVIIICCTFLGQRMYRTQIEEETQNLLRVSFANLENTLHTLDSIALNLVNDRTVQKSLLSLQNVPEGVVLLDDFYAKIISASLVVIGRLQYQCWIPVDKNIPRAALPCACPSRSRKRCVRF